MITLKNPIIDENQMSHEETSFSLSISEKPNGSGYSVSLALIPADTEGNPVMSLAIRKVGDSQNKKLEDLYVNIKGLVQSYVDSLES